MLSQLRKECSLTLPGPEPKFIRQGVTIEHNRVTSSEVIPEGQLIFECSPVLSYCSNEVGNEGGLLSSLHSLSEDQLVDLRYALYDVYPRSKEDTMRCLKVIYEGMLPGVIKPEYIIVAQCVYSAFQSPLGVRFLYTEPSKMNHSCNPNCNWVITEDRLTVRARRTILPYEELTITYIPRIEFCLGRIRRNKLIERGFYCQCESCIDRCHTCDLPKSKDQLLRCSACKTVSYCSKECQKTDWKEHKNLCRRVRL